MRSFRIRPFSFSGATAVGTWPFGSLGALVITSGQTVTLTAGSSYDYSSVNIQAGGTLAISGTSGNPTIIGVDTTFTNNGTLIGGGSTYGALHNGGTFSTTAPDSYAFSYTITQAAGGAGGKGGNQNTTGAAGGAGTNGYGGGGGGGSCNNGFSYPGGLGGVGNAAGQTKTGGTGGAGGSTSGNGSNASGRTGGAGGGSGGGSGTYTPEYGSGAGGGGGMKGKHGKGVYIRCTTLAGNGVFNLSASNGFNGGNGSQGSTYVVSGKLGNTTYVGGTGGGGGTGAGGSGGKLIVRCTTSTFSGTINVAAGTRGATVGTSPAVQTNNVSATAGVAGSLGVNGTAGSSSIITGV